MGFEQLPSSQKEGEQQKQKPKTTLYKPFEGKEKHQKVMQGIKIDAEKEAEEEKLLLSDLESELEDTKKVNKELANRLRILQDVLKPNKLWTKVDVSGEEHTIAYTGLEMGGKSVSPEQILQKDKLDENLSKTSIHFRLSKTAGRAEHLFLFFSTPIETLLRGGGKIEQELEKLITRQFAGTSHYYKTLEKMQQEKEQPLPESETYKKSKQEIKDTLEKQGVEVSETVKEDQSGFLYGVVARFPQEDRQIHVSTVDKELWNVVVVENQKTKRELFNLRPQEVIAALSEQQK